MRCWVSKRLVFVFLFQLSVLDKHHTKLWVSLNLLIFISGDYKLYAMDITEKKFDVNQIILHPKYHPESLNNDIALIMLEKPVSFNNYIQPICLPSVNEKIQYGKVCYVSGKWRQRQKIWQARHSPTFLLFGFSLSILLFLLPINEVF